MFARLILVLSPIVAALAIAAALFYAYLGVLAFRRGDWQFGVFYTLFAVGGLALGTALWRARRQFGRQGPR